MRGSRGGG